MSEDLRDGLRDDLRAGPRHRRRSTGARSGFPRLIRWVDHQQGVHLSRLRTVPYLGRALATYSRYYRIDLRDAASAVVYYSTLSLLPVLVLGYLGLAWLAQRHPHRYKNADQNLAKTIGIPVQDVSSLFDAQAHALLTATTSIIGVMGVLYGAWAWMNTLARAQRTIWGTEDDPVPWRRGVRDAVAALAAIPLMFLGFAVSGMSWGHLQVRWHRSGLSWQTAGALVLAVVLLTLGTVVFAVVCQQLCRRLGGAPASRDLWLSAGATGLCTAVLSAVAQETVRHTASNPYGIVIDFVGLMVWVSIVIRIHLSLTLWAAEEDPSTAHRARLQSIPVSEH